jgi:Excreted virulence factor EspC, type VII ESX diderm
MGRFAVQPSELWGAGTVFATAAGELGSAQPAARKAEAHASEIHYQAAAGTLEAVAQKAGASLTLVRAMLNGLDTGLGNAADAYQRSDRLGRGPR